MRTRNSLLLLLLLNVGLISGCGQKGPLFLPGSPSEVQSVTQPSSVQPSTPEEEDDDDSGVPDR